MKFFFILLLFISSLFANSFHLDKGWNLVGGYLNLTLEQLQNQISMDNLLVVQGPEKVYKKAHIDAGLENLNDFTKLEDGKGYWIKLNKNAILEYTPRVKHNNSETLTLNSGWSMVSFDKNITIAELKDMLGVDNLLAVQGDDKTYQKSYVDNGFSSANDLEYLVPGKGYWIKVDHTKTVEVFFNLDKIAVDNRNKEVIKNIGIDGVIYTIKVYVNTIPTSETSQSTIALIGNINSHSTDALLKLNSSYSKNSAFSVRVFKDGKELARSNDIKYTTSPIDFGNINFTPPNVDKEREDATFDGLKVFAKPLSFDNYNLDMVDDSYFNNLSLKNRYIVANKLMSTLYYGMPKTKLDKLIADGNFISYMKNQLSTPNSDIAKVEQEIAAKYYNWSEANAFREKILARLYYLSLGKEFLNRWEAYILTQTILFSPANELETVKNADIIGVYNRLVRLIDDSYSMRMITYLHMTSEENWRRFRSPEDNSREMLEIYTLDFNDSHVPLAAKALKNWHLSKKEGELIIDLDENSDPVNLFGTTIVNGFDFYKELVKSSAFTVGVTKRLVDYFFSQTSQDIKSSIVSKIVNSNPHTFRDIILQIVFSKEYLVNSQRVKTVEETTFNFVKTISFYHGFNFTQTMRDYMDKMHQSPQKYKLGRSNIVPTDTLSFAYYHDFIRRYLLTDVKTDQFNEWDRGWTQAFIDKDIPNTNTLNGFINYIFNTIIQRDANSEELNLITDYVTNKSRYHISDVSTYNNRFFVALVTMEYISRLTETYKFKKIEE